MKLDGFIGPAYTLDSVNVDAQRCVNLYPEIIESGRGKEGQVAYLRGTPGLEKLLTVGDGPIRCIHVDSIGRTFVVSGNKIYTFTYKDDWELLVTPQRSPGVLTATQNSTYIDTTENTIAAFEDDDYSDDILKVRFESDGALPGGISGGTDYWIFSEGIQNVGGNDCHILKVASSLANAIAGTEIDITSTGTGNLDIIDQAFQDTDI